MISKFRNCFVYDGKNADIWSLNLIAKFNFSHLCSRNLPKCHDYQHIASGLLVARVIILSIGRLCQMKLGLHIDNF